VEPDEGELACGTVGPDGWPTRRRSSRWPGSSWRRRSCREEGRGGGGATAEDIDPVRYLTNRSSGKMGFAMAVAARRFGADVTLVAGPSRLAGSPFVKTVRVRSAKEMMGRWERRRKRRTRW